MTIKCKKADVNAIFDWYRRFADEKMAKLYGTQPSVYDIAYYTPSNANWSYRIGLVKVDDELYKVVTIFGEVRAVMPVNMPEYTMETLKARG